MFLIKYKLKGGTLPIVLVLCVLMLLVLLFLYSYWELQTSYYRSYHTKKQKRIDLISATNLFCVDSMGSGNQYGSDSTILKLYEDDNSSVVALKYKPWGLYQVLISRGVNCKDSKESICLLGGLKASCYNSTLWLCDRDRALSLSGNTKIEGLLHIPKMGINYTEVDGAFYKGEEIDYKLIKDSQVDLPEIDTLALSQIERLRSKDFAFSNYSGKTYNSFSNDIEIVDDSELQETKYFGQFIFYADTLTIPSNCSLEDMIIIAKKVRIESGFSGRLQIFAQDSVIIENDVRLRYPSGVFVGEVSKRPYLYIGENSELSGYGIILGAIIDDLNPQINYKQARNTTFKGLLYVDGIADLKGSLNGACYLKDCFYSSKGNYYPGTLFDISLSQSKSISYPFFIKKRYQKRKIKLLH